MTLDPGTLAGSYHWRIMPAVPFAADMGPGQWGAPAHVLVTFDYAGPDDVMRGNDARWIAIYPVAAYRDQWDAQDDDTVATTLDALQSLLAEQPDTPEAVIFDPRIDTGDSFKTIREKPVLTGST